MNYYNKSIPGSCTRNPDYVLGYSIGYLTVEALAANTGPHSTMWMIREMANKDISFEIAESLDVNIQKLNRALEDGEAATLLRAEVDTSIEFGVFGSPTFRVDNELFFGVEKMEVLNEWLTLGGW